MGHGINSILQERFQKKEKAKMSELGSQTSQGQLTPFSGLFGMPNSGEKEKKILEEILSKYSLGEEKDVSNDLKLLLAITSEVKAINNQAVLLHGERIKKAQEILKKYREGAFTAWLQSAYGNRQTPYNFLQYYEFYLQMPKTLHPQIELMPRQAIYTLASREGAFSKKEEIVRNYQGESKQQMMSLIRAFFPLKENDHRRENVIENAIKQLERLKSAFMPTHIKISSKQKHKLLESLELLKSQIEKN
jgi:hypothetical protein